MASRGACTVRDFGAKGDNHTEDTAAVAAAVAQCDSVHFPAGYKFLLRPIRLRSHQQLVIDGTLVAWPYLTYGRTARSCRARRLARRRGTRGRCA